MIFSGLLFFKAANPTAVFLFSRLLFHFPATFRLVKVLKNSFNVIDYKQIWFGAQ